MAQKSNMCYSDFQPTRKDIKGKDLVLFDKLLLKAKEKKDKDEKNTALTRCLFYAQSKSDMLKGERQGTSLNKQHDLLVKLQKKNPKDYSDSQKAYVKEIRGNKHQQAIKRLEDM
ncbi:hypothetical protein BS50DRAFT_664778 [Corynespora cassiicola Philippines]|uniref:Uncharacterized protein n=1 Tax=Corynespora cassiicola Philippines TaxID=1448308 RepID=A0A2T2N019_CORCC|nr:hypothetical protein BS50DRAFT_664778 [Corynespora cassiicola Philippines]